MAQVRQCRGAHNRLGFALQLVMLRFLHFPLPSVEMIPEPIIHFVSLQVGVDPVVLEEYSQRREQTRDDHAVQIREYLGLRAYTAADSDRLLSFLIQRALQRDDPGVLTEEAEEWLRKEHILFPALSTIQRLMAQARATAEEQIHHTINRQLKPRQIMAMEGLLEKPHGKRGSLFAWVKEPPRTASAKAILELVEKLKIVRDIRADQVDLSPLNRNRVRELAQLGRSYFNTALRRFNDEKRRAILICFLQDLHQELTDYIVDMLDVLIARIFTRSEKELNVNQAKNGKTINASMVVMRRAVKVILNKEVPDPDVRRVAFQEVPEARLQAAYDAAENVVRPEDYNHFDYVEKRYPHLREFLPTILEALPFTGTQAASHVIRAIEVLKELDAAGRRKVPDGAPIGFVNDKWRRVVLSDEGEINRRMWELCLAEQIRHSIKASDLHVVGSRQHKDWTAYLHSPQAWAQRRESWFTDWHAAVNPDEYLDHAAAVLDETLKRVASTWDQNTFAQIVDGKLELAKDEKVEIPESAVALRQAIAGLLPRVKLTDLLVEVDSWAGFREHFRHPNERKSGPWAARGPLLDACIFAVVLAKGCNLPLTTMSDAADIPYHHLTNTSDWYVREECIRRAIVALVDYHHSLPLSSAFGPGTASMSDGIRFGVSARSLYARHNPRYFGVKRGITVYDMTSDQYSHPYVQVIQCNLREAVAVLDGVLHHETELPLREHMTDTHGYTEILFGLFELESRLFSPRIRDLPEQRLYPMDRLQSYGELDVLLRGPSINRDLIRQCWDDMHRVAASLKDGTVTATLLVSKLHNLERKNGIHKGIQELGRLHKTLFVLKYISDEQYRRRIHRTLNKGEALHSLAREIFFGQQGMFRERDYESQLNRATCLSLLINAIAAWNTRYMMAAIEHLRATGYPVNDSDLTFLSPLLWEHINLHGSYHFDLNAPSKRQGLRPLRTESE
jgi:TnpA family transposase